MEQQCDKIASCRSPRAPAQYHSSDMLFVQMDRTAYVAFREVECDIWLVLSFQVADRDNAIEYEFMIHQNPEVENNHLQQSLT